MEILTCTDMLQRISISNLDVGTAHWVDITHINNPHSFYVRPTLYRKYIPILRSYRHGLLPPNLHVRQNVIYKSQLMQCFVRGQVLYIETNDGETFCDLYAPDYGCLEKSVPLKRLRKPSRNIAVPPLAIHCQLADCNPRGETWSQNAIESMKIYVGNERARMVIKAKTTESLIVELSNSCPDDIATMLVLCGYTTLGYGDNVISRFTSTIPEKHYFTYQEFNVGDELNVRVQSGDSLQSFYVAKTGDYKHYLNERDNFTYASKNQPMMSSYDVRAGAAVGVLIDTYSKYERAIIKEITVPESRVIVQLIDWGKILEVPYNRLKPMTVQSFTFPALAIYCAAEESQAWNNGLQRFLYPGYEFKMVVVKVGDKFNSPNVVYLSPITSI